MNQLEFYCKLNQLSEIAVVNRLQNNGIISDNAVLAKDVSDADCAKACEWLRKANDEKTSQ
jgi:hypothetical protein